MTKEILTPAEKRYYSLFPELTEFTYNPMNDVIFKFIFGSPERKQITLDFLNTVVAADLGHLIKDLQFEQTETIPFSQDEKLTRLDIACILDTGEMVDIEVQVTNYHNMQRRTMYYWSRMYLMSLPPGGHYQDLKPCITVNLLKFNLLPQKDPVSMWSIYNPQTGDRLNKDLVFYFLEVPKYSKLPPKPIKEMSKIERWLTYFANKLTKKEKEELIMSDPAIREATKSARVFLQNRKERLAYINRELAELDYNSERKSLIEEGENKLGKLIAKLAQENKFADMSKAAVDPDFREKLYKTYNIE